jgi:hypothetical protein
MLATTPDLMPRAQIEKAAVAIENRPDFKTAPLRVGPQNPNNFES